MSKLLSKLSYFIEPSPSFSGSHGVVTREDRSWEEGYRRRWQHDKIVRSTHGVNCTGSCSWKIYVKGGIVTWETQQTDYPRTRPDMPNHEPRGCARGAWYSLVSLQRQSPEVPDDPRPADEALARGAARGRAGRSLGFDRRGPREAERPISRGAAWAASFARRGTRSTRSSPRRISTRAKKYGPDRIVGFSPIPAMSMVSYAAGSRYLSLIGGVCMSFYDWYCDLPPSSPQTWGEQTDVPESADWYNSTYIVAWGSNVPQTRTPDAHFFTEARYKGTKTVAVTPDYAEVSKLADLWLHPKQGTDAALAMAAGHVILTEYHVRNRSAYFEDYCRRYTDMPMLGTVGRAGRLPGAGTLPAGLRLRRRARRIEQSGVEDRRARRAKATSWSRPSDRSGTAGARKANGICRRRRRRRRAHPARALAQSNAPTRSFRLLSRTSEASSTSISPRPRTRRFSRRNVAAKKVMLKDGEALVATVYDLFLANYGIDRGLGGENVAKSYDDDVPYTPAWQERVTGVPRQQVIRLAREFADNADKTHGKSMVIIGAAMNHWYHSDMNYRGVINLLVMCGCVGQSGGGWAHYVGQEKLRPQTGWTPLAFALDWARPPRQMNSTSFFYAHTDQWRYEQVSVKDILSPLADPALYTGSLIDFNVRAERMGWLPSAPALEANSLELTKAAAAEGLDAKEFAVRELKTRHAQVRLRGPGQPGELPAQHVRVAL